MFFSLLLRTLLPFGLPILMIIMVIYLARTRFPKFQAVPIWVWLLTIGLILVGWIVFLLIRWRREKADAAAIENGILSAAGSTADVAPARRAELETIQKNMQEAIAELKSGPQGKKALYTVPWYMIIGPPAIGKTTVILNSGLNFPNMTTAKRLRGQGGTRNCDWWFSSDAILLDTAGRYAQSSDRSETEEEWFGFLDLLKDHRKKNPLNGLIVGYSCESLIENDDDRIIHDARELRQRIDEMMTRMGFTFPIYLLFTKCDLVSGFADFFSSLAPVERQQAWGTTFPVPRPDGTRLVDHFMVEFDLLIDRARDFRARRLAGAGAGEEWGKIFLFPEELAALRNKLHLFMETIFEGNPFSVDQPTFRGAYFSSGRQMGKPFDSVVQQIHSILGSGGSTSFAEEQVEKEDAYFVRDLFSKLLPHDNDLSRRSNSGSKSWFRLQITLSVVFAVLALLACVFISTSYFRLNGRMDATKDAIAEFEKRPQDLAPDVETIDTLYKLREEIGGSWKAWPLSVVDNVHDAATELYLDALRGRVLQPLEDELSEQLSYPDDLDGDQIRRSLRSELLLLYPEEQGRIGDEKDLASGLFHFGIVGAEDDPDALPRFEVMCKDFLTAGIPLHSADVRSRALREGSRALRATHTEDAFFRSIVAGASRDLEDLTIGSLAGRQKFLESSEKIRVAFTQTGWSETVKDQIKNVRKVIEKDNELVIQAGEAPSDSAPKEADLIALYVDAFPEEWADFLESIDVQSFADCDAAVDDYKDLKHSKQSPVLKTMRTLARQSDFGARDDDLKPITTALKSIIMFDKAEEDGDPTAAGDYRDHLNDVYGKIADCADGKAAEESRVFRDALDTVDDYFDTFDGSVVDDAARRFLRKPIEVGDEIVNTGIARGKAGKANKEWKDVVLAEYQGGIAGRYPFGAGSKGANVNSIVEIVKSGGSLAKFKDELDELDLQPRGGAAAAIRSAEKIRNSLNANAGGLSASFRIELLAPRSTNNTGEANLRVLDLITLVVNGEQMTRKTSNREHNFHWNSAPDDTDCSLKLEHTEAGRVLGSTQGDGSVWAWCRLLDKANVKRQGSGYLVSWSFPDAGLIVDAKLTMLDGGECPFVAGSTFRKFTVPGSAF